MSNPESSQSPSPPALVLYPEHGAAVTELLPQLRQTLRDAGLLGEALAGLSGERYLAGPAFLQQISFVGCSPAIEFEAPQAGSEKFCHVRLSVDQELQFRGGPHQVQVRCPQCRKVAPDWAAIVEAWRSAPEAYRYVCGECGVPSAATALNWRKTGAFARVFVELLNIYPHEAIPTEGLLQLLRHGSGGVWRYIYVR